MPDIDPKMRKSKEAIEADLLSRPGVVGVDIGYKEVGGQQTDILAIRVLVRQKRDVPANERIPTTIEGYPTDVIQREIQLHVLRVPVGEVVPEADTGSYDPLVGGIGIGPCRSVGGSIFAGTLGAPVVDNATSSPMLLSNFHVMCIDNTWQVGDTMAQPSLIDTGSCPGSVVGALQRASLGGQVDCAIASRSARGISGRIADIGRIAGTNTATLGQAVRKQGRTTGLTYGTVDGIHATVQIDYGNGIGLRKLTEQIGVKPDTTRNPKFSDHGDSGAVVVNDSNEVVGLNFAGNDTGYAYANPIAAVLSSLNISFHIGTPDFNYQGAAFLGGAAKTWTDVQFIPTSWGVLAFNPSDGSFVKWYNTPGVSSDFNYQTAGVLGGAPKTWTDVQFIPTNFGVLAFNPSDGSFVKWYDTPGVSPDFNYQTAGVLGGAAKTWTNVQFIPTNFGVLAFNPSDGSFAKWYPTPGVSSDFNYQTAGVLGGAPNTWTNVQFIRTNFGVLAFNPSDGSFAKWYNTPGVSSDFNYQTAGVLGGAPNTWTNVQFIRTSWGVLAFNPSDGSFVKWYDTPGVSPDFNYQEAGILGGAPNTWTNVQFTPTSWGVLAFNPSDGSFAKWYEW